MSSEESEEDLHQCGRCKAVFNKITDYMCHKKSRVCQKSTTAGALHKSQHENDLFIRHVIDEVVASKSDTCDETQSAVVDSTPESPVAAFSPSGVSDPGVALAVNCDEAHRPDSRDTLLVAHESSSALFQADSVESSGANSLERSSAAASQCMSIEAPIRADTSSDASLQESPSSDVIEAGPVCTSEPCRPQPYQCPKCNFTAAHRDDFDQHLRREHCLSAHVCPQCKRPQANAHKLKWHKRRCKKIIENATDGEFSVGKYLPMQRRKKSAAAETVPQRSFQCKICSAASFDSYDSVLSHVSAEHSAIRPGICRFCGMWFENVYKLRRHVTSSVHDDDVSDADLQSFKAELEQITVRYTADAIRLLKQACQSRAQQQLVKQCELCRLSFCSRHALLRHQRVVHSQQRQQMTMQATIDTPTISCQHCGMSFDRRRAYLRHRRDTHCKLVVEPSSSISLSSSSSGLKQCNVCGRTFKHSSHAKRHQRLLHSTRQQIPYAILTSSFVSVACNDVAVSSVKQSDEQCFVCFTFLASQRDLVCHLELYHRVWVLRATVQSTELQHFSDNIIQNPVAAFRFVEEQSAAFQQRPNGSLLKDSNASETAADRRGGTCDVGSAAGGVDCLRDSCVVRQSADAAVLPTTGSSSASLATTRHMCPYCSSSFSTLEEIYRHKVAEHHLEAVFRCVNPTCLAQFRKLADYKLHVANSGHSQVAFICSVCNEHFADKPMLLWHRSSTHRHVKSSIVRSSKKLSHTMPSGKHKASKKTASSSQLGFKSKQCSICKARFSSRGAVARHRVVAHAVGIHCTQCNCIFAKREHFQRHYMSRHSSSKPHACVEPGCGRSFKRKDKLLEHIRCHVSSSSDNNVVQLSFACSKCDSRFRRRDSLRRHEKSHHLQQQQPALTPAASRQSQHKCTRCPAKFSHLSKLLQHLHREHGRGAGKDVYAHQCSTCGKQFPRPERLKRHVERVHNISTNWLHRCSYCGKGFSGTRSYDAHMTRHHSNGESGSTVEHPRQHHSKRGADVNPPIPDEDNGSSPACGLSADTPTHQLYPVSVSANVTTSSLIPFDHSNHNNLIYSSNFGRLLASSVDPANITVSDSGLSSSSSQVYTSLTDSVVSAELSRRSCNESQFTRAATEHDAAAVSSRPGYYQSPPCSLPCLHHPGANLGSSAYSVYSSGYRSQPASYRAPSQFGFYHTPQFAYSSYPSVAACSGLFSETNNSLLPPFGARSSWSQLESSQQSRWSSSAAVTGNADIRTSALDSAPAACSCQTSTTTTTTPVRSLVHNHMQSTRTAGLGSSSAADDLQPAPNRCFGRWFDHGVPSLLSSAPSVDQANLDPASCWSRPPVLTPSLIDPTPYHCFGAGTSAVSSSSDVAVKGLSNFGRTSTLPVTTENSSMAFSYGYPSFKSYQYPSAVDGKIYSVGSLGLASRNYENHVSASSAPSGAESSIFSRRSMGSLHYHQHQQQYAGTSSSSSSVPAVHVPLSLLPPPAPPPTTPQHHNRFRQQFANYQHWPPSMPMYNRF